MTDGIRATLVTFRASEEKAKKDAVAVIEKEVKLNEELEKEKELSFKLYKNLQESGVEMKRMEDALKTKTREEMELQEALQEALRALEEEKRVNAVLKEELRQARAPQPESIRRMLSEGNEVPVEIEDSFEDPAIAAKGNVIPELPEEEDVDDEELLQLFDFDMDKYKDIRRKLKEQEEDELDEAANEVEDGEEDEDIPENVMEAMLAERKRQREMEEEDRRMAEEMEKKQEEERNEDKCICCDYNFEEKPRITLSCGHDMFHEHCIKKWFEQKADCPFCRKHIKLEEEYPSLRGRKNRRR